MPPHALPNGTRLLTGPGNTGPTPHWKLRGLLPGTYYWSVQSINDSFAASPFSIEGTFSITNTRPSAAPMSLTLAEDSILGLTLEGFDAESLTLTYTIVDPTTNGLLTGFAPFFNYRPRSNYFGPDSFSFTVHDGLTNAEPARVTLTITPVKDASTLQLSLRQMSGAEREFSLSGEPFALHVIESSENLSEWSPVATVRAGATGLVTFTMPPGADKQFYRVRPTLP